MKILVFMTAVASTILAIGAETASSSPEDIDAKRTRAKQMFLQKTGGYLNKPGTQRGEICYINCQSRAPLSWINESIAYFGKETKFKISLRENGSFDLNNPKIEGNATLFIIDDAALPAILVAPENRWAFVNIAPIAKEQRPAYFEARVKKELTRGFSFLCGATNSQFPRALTRGIVDHADLDKNPDFGLPIDVLQRFRTYMETLGVQPAVVATYRKACQEGWAPAPTNEYQKAIWEKVRSIPAEPMRIEFDPKKDK